MTNEGFKRKLTAILSADAVGYSRLMAEDEPATVKTIASYREIMTSLIKQHRGRVVDSPGDNLLAEFSSVVDAVQCAVAVQNEFQTHNAELAENRRMEFRIGINLGDVIDEEDRIYGDGVNVAARLEALADPGGICVSKTAFDQIETKLPLGYEYLGEQSVKNIPKPVGAYRVLMKPDAIGKVIGEKRFLGWMSRKSAMAAILALSIIIGGLVSYYIYLHQSGRIEPASIEKMAFPLPDKPSIAVLPFKNMSGDANQEFFSDGITEHIITSLSKVPYIFVIARHSTFTYKNKFIEVQHIAEKLGVRYVLKGSVQRSDDRVRITAQLIDASEGHLLWADSFDRKVDDLFKIQDQIAMKIMAALQVNLSEAELGQYFSTKTTNIKAYEKYLESYEHQWRRTEGDTHKARILANEAIALDPEYGAPYVVLAFSHLDDVWYYRSKSRTKSLQKAKLLIQKAIDLSGHDAWTHRAFGSIYVLNREFEKAVDECQKSIEFSPNSAESHFYYGWALRFAGRFNEAIIILKKAIRLNPITPIHYLNGLAWAYTYSEQYEQAIRLWKRCLERNPDYLFGHMGLTLAFQLSGNETMSRESAQEVLRIKPDLTVSKIKKGPKTNNIDRKLILETFRKAGIPD
jgi:adenylate cyclase